MKKIIKLVKHKKGRLANVPAPFLDFLDMRFDDRCEIELVGDEMIIRKFKEEPVMHVK